MIWNINKIYDKQGNYITFSYNELNSSGEFYPKSIEYTGNTNTGLTPFSKVKFFYEEREDVSKAYIHGSVLQQSVLLNKILVTTDGDGGLSHQYEFKYSKDIYSHLNEIVEYGSDGSNFNSTIINWGEETTQFVESTSFDNNDGNKFYFGDFNGDGKDDFVRTPDKTTYSSTDKWELFLNQNGTYFTKSDEDTLSDSYLNLHGTDHFFRKNLGLQTVDFNGDGLDDIVLVEYQEITYAANPELYVEYSYYYDPPFYNYYYKVLLSDGQHLNHDPDSSRNFNQNNAKVIFGDFDGNGKTDLWAIYEEDDLYNYEIYPIDFNGDGKTDIMAINHNSSFDLEDACIIYDGNSSVELYHSGFPTKWHRIFPGDFNGDGKTDMLTWTSAGWRITYSNGNNGFVWPDVPAPMTRNYDPDASDLDYNYFVSDFNGDGKSDIFEMYSNEHDGVYDSKLNIYYSDGNNFIEESHNFGIPGVYGSHLNFGDFNGDGKQQCFYKGFYLDPATIISMHPNEKKNLVHSITNGYNVQTEISYKPITDNAVYTKGSGAVFPVSDFQKALYVISSVKTENGIGGTNTTNYLYEGAKVHKQGKGLLGFMKTTASTSGISTSTQEYELLSNASYCALLLKKQSAKNSYGSSISEVNYSNSIKNYGGKRIFPYLTSTTSNDFLKGITITTSYTYNPTDLTYGNLSSVSINHNGEATTTTSNQYITAGAWCPNKISSSTMTKSRTGESGSFGRTTSFNYNTTTGLLTSKTADPGKSKSVTTSYLYDLYGNITKITTAASGLESRYLNMFYDTKGRFVTKKTNAIGHSVNLTYENSYGQVTSSTDANGNTVENKYDGFGRLKETINPTGQHIYSSLGWTSGSGPTNSLYYAITSTSGAGDAKEYFDGLGRSLRTETTGFDGTKIYSDIEYKSNGQVLKTSNPYYSINSPAWTTNSYDSFLRLSTQSGPTATFNYSYNGETVTTTNTSTGQSSSQTMDAIGNIVSSTDAGGTVSYSYNNAGLIKQVTGVGATFTLEYDEYGNQTNLVDPNAGPITYQHNAFGEIISQTDARGNTFTMTYDKLGRMISKTTPEGTSTYTYDTETYGKGLLASLNGPDNMGYSYNYDQYGRITHENEKIEGVIYSTSYSYDAYGNVSQVEYPSGFKISKIYNSNGYLQEIRRVDNGNLIWKAEEINALMQVEQSLSGDNIRTYQTYDSNGIPTGVQSGSIFNWQYTFNTSSGNLTSRKDNIFNLTESFSYDALNRLTSISKNGVITSTLQYANSGNISYKSDAGNFNYAENGAGINALTSIDNPNPAISTTQQDIDFTSFSKVSSISEGDYELLFKYGPEQERRKTELLQNNNVELTKIFATNYEKNISDSNTKELHYIWGGDGLAAVYIIDNGQGNMYYVYKDHLGSILALTNESGSIVSRNSFDAWGRPRNPTNWSYSNVPVSILDRGFTGHEHLEEFNLINMNGRVYDPIIGRFLSVDPYVQDPGNTQGLNRYSYCLNNPLVYTDPDGEWFITALMTLANAYLGGLQSNDFKFNPMDWDWGSFSTYYSIFTSGLSGYNLGGKIEDHFKNMNDSKELGSFMQKRAKNSDATFGSSTTDQLTSYPVKNLNYDELYGLDIMNLYDLSYEEFNALNPGTKVVWRKNEFFNVLPPDPSKMPLGFPPDPTIGVGLSLGLIHNSPMAIQNWFVGVGRGQANRVYFKPDFGLWEWKWSIPNIEKQVTLFGSYSRSRLIFTKLRWRGIYPYSSFYQTNGGFSTNESVLTYLGLLIQ
jgi:RHS repeat-associated protein